MKATVQWFNQFRGFGVAEMDDGRTVFCHKSQMKDVKSLRTGDKIKFDLYEEMRDDVPVFVARNIEVI